MIVDGLHCLGHTMTDEGVRRRSVQARSPSQLHWSRLHQYFGYVSPVARGQLLQGAHWRASVQGIVVCAAALLLAAGLLWWAFARRRVYLVDYSVYRSPDR